jgi:hypothetical protein
VRRELSHHRDIRLLGPLSVAGQLEILDHPSTKLRHGSLRSGPFHGPRDESAPDARSRYAIAAGHQHEALEFNRALQKPALSRRS